MNISHLKYALEVEKTGSISQAAENLYMGQPNLSRAIRELEASVGITLFIRTAKGVTPTKKGAEFLSYARNLLTQLSDLEMRYRPNGKARGFAVSVPRASYITYAFSKFINGLKEDERDELNFIETGTMRTIENVLQGEFNFGIIRYKTEYEKNFLNYLEDNGIRYKELWEFDMLTLMSEKHYLAKRSELKCEDLRPCVELVHGDLSIPMLPATEIKRIELADASSEHKIYVYERGSQYELLLTVPKTYMWVSPLPREMLRRYQLTQKACLCAERRYKDILIYMKGYEFGETENKFIRELHSVWENMSCE